MKCVLVFLFYIFLFSVQILYKFIIKNGGNHMHVWYILKD